LTKRNKTLALALAAAASIAAGLGAAVHVRAADEPGGYVGKGQLVVRTSIGGSTSLTIGGDVAIEELGSRLRLDVLSLAIPGTDPTISALLGTQLFPPGGFTIVYDRTSASFTVWSNAKRRYYTNASAAPQPATPIPEVSAGGTASDLFSIFSFAKSLKNDDAFNVALGMTAHHVVNGHPATGLNFQYLRTTKASGTTDLHGTFEFADDLDGVPVEITVAGKSRAFPESALRLDFSSLVKQTPPDTDFDPPPGFARAASIGDVIGKTLPIPSGQ
jgi:hypothetical protein